MNAKKIALMLVLFSFCISIAVAQLTMNLAIPNQGTIGTINVQCDTSQIMWGTVYPLMNVSDTVSFAAINSVPVVLTFNTSDYTPSSASSWLTLSWNYSGAPINSTWTPIAFTLTVGPDATSGPFSFTITVTGTQYLDS